MNAFQKIVHSKTLIICVSVLILYTLSGFVLLPYLVNRLAPEFIAEKLHRELRLGDVKINPFLLSFQARDAGLYEPDGTMIAGFKECLIDFELSSLFRWALVFKTFRLSKPKIKIIIDETGEMNLARLGTSSQSPNDTGNSKEEAPTDTGPPRLVLHHIQIAEGEIDLIDQRHSVPATVAIRPLNIELNDISTLPDREGPYRLAAITSAKESFQWSGEITLNPFKSKGHIGFRNIRVPTVWQFARDSLAIVEPQGRFSITTGYEIDLGQAKPSVCLTDLRFGLDDLIMRLPETDTPLLALSRLDIDAPLLDVTRRIIDVAEIRFIGGSTEAEIDTNGRLNYSRIASQPDANEQPETQAVASYNATDSKDKPSTPWKIKVAETELKDIRFRFLDKSRAPVLQAGVSDIDGNFQFNLSSGSADIDLNVRDAVFALNDIRIENPQTPEPEIRVENWRLNGGNFDLESRNLSIEAISFQDGSIDLLRETDGRLNLVHLFSSGGANASSTPNTSNESGKSPFHYVISKADLSNFNLFFGDRVVKPEGQVIHLENLGVTASGIDGRSQMPVDLAFDVREGGRVVVQCRVDPLEPAVEAEILVDSLSLLPFEPYLEPHASVRVDSGTISTQGEFAFRQDETRPRIAYNGAIDVSDLRILSPDSAETLLGWKRFGTQALTLRLQPDLIEVADLKLTGLDGKFIIFEDGSLNLTKVFKNSLEDAADSAAKEEPQIDVPEESEGQPFPIHISKLRVEDGSLFFADHSLIPKFATRMHQLEGSVIGMSSSRGAQAQVDLAGRVDDYGLSKINGEISMFDPAAYTDMSVIFRNLEMTRMTPYSGKFVGRRIDAGKLSLDLKYFIENGKLKGDNQIVIERIALGERIDSPDAVSLPLNLAIAILEDADGIIDLGLPVSGDLSDPKFSYGGIIWKAFTNVIKKIATSPFRALAALLGSDSESLDAIAFENGSADLLPPEIEKLAGLAQALEKRPNLKLLIQGRYSRENDGAVLKAIQVRRHITERQGLALMPDEDPGKLDFGNPGVQKTLEDDFSERQGPDALQELKTAMTQPPGDGSDQAGIRDPAAFWKALYERMVAGESLPDSALIQLGENRARSILRELQDVKGLPQKRVEVIHPQALKPGQAAQATLTLEALQSGQAKIP